MPKIPTYDQLGQRVKAPTTQLGLKADTQVAYKNKRKQHKQLWQELLVKPDHLQ